MKINARSNEAVSPVVAVMLMLVVTIIIAAVVSAFAGGMVGGQKTTPQATLQGAYSQSNGMTITLASGDTVALSQVNFITTPSDVMGPDGSKFAWIINKSIILNPSQNNVAILNLTTGMYNTPSMSAGDTFVITHANCIDYSATYPAPNPSPGVNQNAQILGGASSYAGKLPYFGAYAFGNPSNAGKYFYLDMVDSTGSIIARAKVTITG